MKGTCFLPHTLPLLRPGGQLSLKNACLWEHSFFHVVNLVVMMRRGAQSMRYGAPHRNVSVPQYNIWAFILVRAVTVESSWENAKNEWLPRRRRPARRRPQVTPPGVPCARVTHTPDVCHPIPHRHFFGVAQHAHLHLDFAAAARVERRWLAQRARARRHARSAHACARVICVGEPCAMHARCAPDSRTPGRCRTPGTAKRPAGGRR